MILDCYNALKRMEQRPAMYTGDHSLKGIQTYCTGYFMALWDHKLVGHSDTVDPFHDWIALQLNYTESTAGWPNMILAHSLGYDPKEIDWELFFERNFTKQEHERSIGLFFELLEEFRNETLSKKDFTVAF